MITFLEKDGKLKCITDIDEQTILMSISKYKFFYNKTLIIKRHETFYTGIDLMFYERNKDCVPQEVQVFTHLELNRTIETKAKVEERITGQYLLDLFIREYEDKFNISYVINNKFAYINKFRKLMDQFYKNELKDLHIKNYIRRCVKFGNHKGDPIYIDFIFNDKVIQNYLLFIKNIKDITIVWPYLDTTLSQLEKKQIKYLMNLKLFDSFSDVEKDICCKLYKKYSTKTYERITEGYKPRNGFMAKEKVFDIISKAYRLTMQELLSKTKHDENYFSYEFTKSQIKEALE